MDSVDGSQIEIPAWYCARTRPKHEHIAAAHLRKNLNLKVFYPRLRVERVAECGIVRVIEPLFPCYVFVHCVLEANFSEIQHAVGISGLVRFGKKIPRVPNSIIQELQQLFKEEEPMTVESSIAPADEVRIVAGAFAGFRGPVLKVLPARMRVQVLFDILGRSTPVEVDRRSVILEGQTLADLAPILAAPHRNESALSRYQVET